MLASSHIPSATPYITPPHPSVGCDIRKGSPNNYDAPVLVAPGTLHCSVIEDMLTLHSLVARQEPSKHQVSHRNTMGAIRSPPGCLLVSVPNPGSLEWCRHRHRRPESGTTRRLIGRHLPLHELRWETARCVRPAGGQSCRRGKLRAASALGWSSESGSRLEDRRKLAVCRLEAAAGAGRQRQRCGPYRARAVSLCLSDTLCRPDTA